MVKLSTKDKKILSILCVDARTPLKTIAKRIGLSVEGTSYRVKRLERKKVITKYTLYPDEYKYGLQIYHIYFKFHTLPSETEESFKKALVDSGYCSLIWKTRGNWDFIVQFYARDSFHFDDLLEKILDREEFRIKRYKANFATHQYCFSQLVGDDFKEFDDRYRVIDAVEDRKGKNTLTETETKLMRTLVNQGRMSYAEMSKQLEIPAETLRFTYNRLKEKKIIITVFASLDRFTLGYVLNAVDITLNTNSQERIRPLINYIKENKNIHYGAKVSGALEIHLALVTKDNKQFSDKLEELRERFHTIIEDIEINPIFSEESESMFPPGY